MNLTNSVSRTQIESPVNAAELMERIGRDLDLLADLLELFRLDSAAHVEACQAALAAGNAKGVERAGHTLKGMLANLSAPVALRLATRLEEMGQENDLAQTAETLQALSIELRRVDATLDLLCKGGAVEDSDRR